MSLSRKLSITAAVLGATLASSQAALTNFYNYDLGGATASWDIFAGANYLPAFSFSTADAGNSISGYAGNLTLNVVNPGHIPGNFPSYASGPIGSDSVVPGDRQTFYTFFAGLTNWSITGIAGAATSSVVFQVQDAGGAGGMNNMTLNGIAAQVYANPSTLVTTYTWSGLDLDAGDSYSLTWTNNNAHSAFDAFQLQTGNGAVPEPSAFLMAGASVLGFISRRKRNRA